MKFVAKDMKKITVILKKIIPDKKKGMIHLKSNGDGVLHIFANNKFIGFYATIDSLNDESFNFLINPHELDKMLTDNDKKKDKKLTEMIFKVNKKSIKEQQLGEAFKVEPSEWDETVCHELLKEGKALPKKADYEEVDYDFIPPSPWGFIQEEELFLQVIKEGYEITKDNTDIRTIYLALRSGKALATEDKRTHLYRLNEQFPFETIFLHKDVLQVLSTTIKKGEIKHKKTNDGFFLQYNDYLYQIHDEQKTVLPNLRKMATKKKGFKFEVDANAVLNVLNNDFKKVQKDKKTGDPAKEVTEVICRFDENNIIFIPNHPHFKEVKVPVRILDGKPTESKFNMKLFKGFFGSFGKNVVVEHLEYRNLKQKDGYLWRIYTPEQLNVTTGISRLDFDLLDRLHKEGKLQKISSLQELEELSEA